MSCYMKIKFEEVVFRREFSKCIENIFIEESFKFLNCTPPWLTSNKSLWCNEKQRIDPRQTATLFGEFLHDVMIGEANIGKCPVPCKVKTFMVSEIGLKEGGGGIEIWFEKYVAVTKSTLKIDVMTLVSKFGGFIGISKNLMWLLIMLISSLGVIFSNLRCSCSLK